MGLEDSVLENNTKLQALVAVCSYELSRIRNLEKEKKMMADDDIDNSSALSPQINYVKCINPGYSCRSFSVDLENLIADPSGYSGLITNNREVHVGMENPASCWWRFQDDTGWNTVTVPKKKRSVGGRPSIITINNQVSSFPVESKNSTRGQNDEDHGYLSPEENNNMVVMSTKKSTSDLNEDATFVLKKFKNSRKGHDHDANKESKRPLIYDENKRRKTNSSIKRNLNLNYCPPLPTEFKNYLSSLNAGFAIQNEVLVIQKLLYKSDIEKQQNRLSIPLRCMKNKFLNEVEERHLDSPRENMKNVNKIEATLIDPLMGNWRVNLRRWDMKKEDASKFSTSLVINGPWTDLVRRNELKKGDLVQLWAARVGAASTLCFALVKLQDC